MNNTSLSTDLVVIGGGAAGVFAAITAAELNQNLQIVILEQGNDVLGKVKISGGGRCNVTHACYDTDELLKFYPRGYKELRSIFNHFGCEQTVNWFQHRGVMLKTETDGRIFPKTDRSQTIIDCFVNQIQQFNISILKQAKVTQIMFDDEFTISVNHQKITAQKLLIATGSSNIMWNILQQNKHPIIPPVPSLFTFNCKNELIKGLEGVTFNNVKVQLQESKIYTEGALLITHTGLSGPSILKLSAFAARILHEKNYAFKIDINWVNKNLEEILLQFKKIKEEHTKKQIGNCTPFLLPNRFWHKALAFTGISAQKTVADLSKNEWNNLAQIIYKTTFQIHSKNTNKEEFVTAGGIDLKAVNFKTMESKIIPNLFFAGEVLNIDAVTGGFNFQAAWATGFVAGSSIANYNK